MIYLVSMQKRHTGIRRKPEMSIEKPLREYASIQLALINIAVYVFTSIAGGSILATSPKMLIILGVSRNSLIPWYWWQLVTAMFTHASIAHLIGNLLFLLIFGLRGEELGFKKEVFTVYLVSGLVGDIVSALISPPNVVSIGASGAVFGVLAFVVVKLREQKMISSRTAFFVVLVFLVLSGSNAGTNVSVNVIAHVIGALTGYFYAKFYLPRKNQLITHN